MWCSAADTHIKLHNCVVSVTRFLTGVVLEFDIAHRRYPAVLFMLYKIRCKCNPMHPLYGALPVPHLSVRVTRSALVSHLYTYAHTRGRNSQFRRTFIPLSMSLWNDLAEPLFDGVGLAVFNGRANAFYFS